MKTFMYKGPESALTVRLDKPGQKEPELLDVSLRDGMQVELPEDAACVKTLVALGHLQEVAEKAAKKGA